MPILRCGDYNECPFIGSSFKLSGLIQSPSTTSCRDRSGPIIFFESWGDDASFLTLWCGVATSYFSSASSWQLNPSGQSESWDDQKLSDLRERERDHCWWEVCIPCTVLWGSMMPIHESFAKTWTCKSVGNSLTLHDLLIIMRSSGSALEVNERHTTGNKWGRGVVSATVGFRPPKS